MRASNWALEGENPSASVKASVLPILADIAFRPLSSYRVKAAVYSFPKGDK